MKRVFQMLLVALVLASCNKKASTEDANADTTTETKTETKTETPAVAYVFNEADWVETDLGAINKAYPILVKMPKTAKITPSDVNPEELLVTINEETSIEVGNAFENTTEEAVKRYKAQFAAGAKTTKILKEDANGFIYEELATEGYDAQYRFFVMLKAKGEGCYVFHNRATGIVGGTKEAAEKMYETIKSSAKLK